MVRRNNNNTKKSLKHNLNMVGGATKSVRGQIGTQAVVQEQVENPLTKAAQGNIHQISLQEYIDNRIRMKYDNLLRDYPDKLIITVTKKDADNLQEIDKHIGGTVSVTSISEEELMTPKNGCMIYNDTVEQGGGGKSTRKGSRKASKKAIRKVSRKASKKAIRKGSRKVSRKASKKRTYNKKK